MTYYRINWEALNALPPAARLQALADITASVQRVCGAERERIVHAEIDRHGGLAQRGSQKAAAQTLNLKQARMNQIAKESPVTVTVQFTTEDVSASAPSDYAVAAGVLSLSGLAGAGAPAATTDWPQWRGPNRDAIAAATGLKKTWENGPPKLLWLRIRHCLQHNRPESQDHL